MECKIQLPCSPLVKAYLHKNYGSRIKLNRHSPIGKFLFNIMSNPCKRYETRRETYADAVDVYISEDEFNRTGCLLTKNDIVDINNMITDQVYGLMYVAIEAREDLQGPDFKIKYAIQWFFGYMQISPDSINIESAVKAYYRFREKRDNKLIIR